MQTLLCGCSVWTRTGASVIPSELQVNVCVSAVHLLPRKRQRRSKATRSFLLDRAGPVISMSFLPLSIPGLQLLLSGTRSWRSEPWGAHLSNMTTGTEVVGIRGNLGAAPPLTIYPQVVPVLYKLPSSSTKNSFPAHFSCHHSSRLAAGDARHFQALHWDGAENFRAGCETCRLSLPLSLPFFLSPPTPSI